MQNPFLTQPTPIDLGTAEEWDFVTLYLIGGAAASGRRAYTDDTTVVLHDCSIRGLDSALWCEVKKMAFNMACVIGMLPYDAPAPLSPKKV